MSVRGRLAAWIGGAEVRADYGNLLAQFAARAANGNPKAANAEQTAAAEFAASLYEGAFAVGRWRPAANRLGVLGPAQLAMIGRALILRGESVWRIETRGGRLRVLPCSDWTVQGVGADERGWRYQLHESGPDGESVRTLPAQSVLHFRRGATGRRPWEGCSPLAGAGITARVLAEVETALADEASGARGYLLPVPKDGGDEKLNKLREDIGGMRGRVTLVETTSAGWGEGRSAAPASDWQPRRIGPAPPSGVEAVRAGIEEAVLSACGVPPSLAARSSDGTAQREAYRRWLHSGVDPLAAVVAAEAGAKLEVDGARLDFGRLRAADVAGKARAFRALVGAQGGNLTPARALSAVGIEEA